MNHASAAHQRATILVCDDDTVLLEVIGQFLIHKGFQVILASSGAEALERCHLERPDMALLDAMMPEITGFQLCAQLRARPQCGDLPVIIITARYDTPAVDMAFAAGAEEYITKPIHWAVLEHRIRGILRHKKADEEVLQHRDKLLQQQELIEEIITRLRHSARFDPRHLRCFQAPAEKTTGDLLLAGFCPDGTQHLLLGDFTGHGLPAAIAGPIVSDIFYTMTRKGLPLAEILTEINERLYEKTPPTIFLAAGFLSLDPPRRCLTVWNCALPDILLFRNGICLHSIPSGLLARGVISQADAPGVCLEVAPGDRVLVYSDGFVEEWDADGQLFGQENLAGLITRMLALDAPLAWIHERLETYRADHPQTDDRTMVELTC